MNKSAKISILAAAVVVLFNLACTIHVHLFEGVKLPGQDRLQLPQRVERGTSTQPSSRASTHPGDDDSNWISDLIRERLGDE